MTTDFQAVDSEGPTVRDGRHRYVDPADDDAPATPRNQSQPLQQQQQQQYHQHSRDSSRRAANMTPTPRDSNEISPSQAAFLSYTSMADVASVSSDFDNEGYHWGDSPFATPYNGPGAASVAGADQCKPQAIPSSHFLRVPSEVKIMSPGDSLRTSPDKDFLSKADLTYLENQNKLLLEQSGMFHHHHRRREHHHRQHKQRELQASSHPDPFEDEDPLDDDEEQQQHTRHHDLGPQEEYDHSSDA
jgi:hypothetical protein